MIDLENFVSDNPNTEAETLLNFAYAKDGRVFLRYADGVEGYDLCTYISDKLADLGYEVSPQEIMDDGMELGNEETEPLAILYTVAVQAAELRGRLRKHESDEPIVHCKDCKLFKWGKYCTLTDDDEDLRNPNDFCSYGEQMEGH